MSKDKIYAEFRKFQFAYVIKLAQTLESDWIRNDERYKRPSCIIKPATQTFYRFTYRESVGSVTTYQT